MFEVVCAILLAVALDRFVPEHLRVDPFAWFRDLAESIEKRSDGGSRSHGIVALAVAVVPVVLLLLILHYLLGKLGWALQFVFDVIVLVWCLDLHRLGGRAGEVAEALQAGEIPVANENLHLLAGEGADDLSEAHIARGAVEAVLKQGNSVVIAPLFWFILFGPFGAVLQRLAGVLHRLWGRSAERLAEFGWAAARFDDILAWLPARITALSYAVMGSFEDALRCWRYRAGLWSDTTNGPLLASGFGAMQMQSCEDLADAEDHNGRGAIATAAANAAHVQRAVALVWRALLFWLALALAISVFSALVN